MKKILISFIGNNDCLLDEGKEGAIISILKERNFDKLYILYNHDRYLKYASDILQYCEKKFKGLKVHYQEAKSLNPIDYNIVYPSMVSATRSILKEEGLKNVEYTISLTSGTPTMHSCWILIVQGGIIPAKLIQVSREQGVSEIDFNLDDFPNISTDNEAKIQLTKSTRENKLLKNQLMNEYSDLIGEHQSIIEVKRKISNLIKYNIPVFIHGESGTGKEIVARCLHYHSNRKEAPFVAVNCGSISEKLFESEFFGHRKGSFTGAIDNHDGYFSQADKGTLFLDEIGDLPLPMQVKLLRVLETGVILPIGGKEKKVDVKIITASNKDLKQMIQEERFREDLFYRIVQAEINMIPLRERGTDIILLSKLFLEKCSKEYSSSKSLTIEAEKKLLKYDYPGNVRELQKIIKMSYINSRSEKVEAEDIIFPNEPENLLKVYLPVDGVDLENDILPAYYQAALIKTNGNKAKAARLLGLEPHTFRARLKNLKISK